MTQLQPFHLTNPMSSLPTPSLISHFWSLGSLLGLTLSLQITSGLILSISYSTTIPQAFDSVVYILSESSFGWSVRVLHANGASILFLLIYLHIGRGLYFSSYRFPSVWISGLLIFMGFIATAFLGYVLPWGQISFWGATVITSLVSTIPYWGDGLVTWLWGGYAVAGPTLTRFFSFHYVLPLLLSVVALSHILFLHNSGSSNPLGISLSVDNVPFHPYFSFKDVIGIMVLFGGWGLTLMWAPWALGDTENFILTNPLLTPEHINPEWYFLFAYAILRCIPSNLGGVVALLASVLVLVFCVVTPLTFSPSSNPTLSKILFWAWVSVWATLTWLGGIVVEDPFIILSQLFSTSYFVGFSLLWLQL